MKHREPPRAAMLAAVLARALPDAKPGPIAHAVGAMIAAAKAHKRSGKACCNYPMTEAQQRYGDRRCDNLARKADDALFGSAHIPPSGRITTDGNGVVIVWSDDARCERVRTLRLEFGGDPPGSCGQLHVSDMPGDGFGPGWAIYE